MPPMRADARRHAAYAAGPREAYGRQREDGMRALQSTGTGIDAH